MFVQFRCLSLYQNDFVSKQLVTENIHSPTIIWRVWFTEGLGLLEPYSHPSGNSSLACFLPHRILAFKILLPQWIFIESSWVRCGYQFNGLFIGILFLTARTSSVATIDSLDDYTRYSDDGARDADERVAGLRNSSYSWIICLLLLIFIS